MLIQQKKVGTKGMFYVEQDGNILAELTYTMASSSKMIIEHTEVSDELKDRKADFQLVYTAVEYSRNHDIKIISLCPFASSVFKRNPEFADVLFNM